MTETRITHKGERALVQMREAEGVEVRWQPPEQRRDVRDMAEAVVVNLVGVGVLTESTAPCRGSAGGSGGQGSTSKMRTPSRYALADTARLKM